MAQAINERNAAADFKIRAFLSGGTPLDVQRAARDVAELFASDVEGTLRGQAPELVTGRIHELVRNVLERRLATMLALEKSQDAENRSPTLPVANLRPSDVIEQRKVSMSLASLYRYVEANKFYCVVPAGQSNGREFPAWQFVEPVPELLQPVLFALRGSLRTEVHAFFVTAQDELNELSPAEILAGVPFETRPSVHPSQLRLLQLPAMERQRRVLSLVRASEKGMAE
ncbi:hypothetical protein AB4Y32_34890 [Paraburkholderia phymatum]|uniref:Uncharacterized protein n=1 Tax=Paraburkholderia phymatum TaxID=148447 RepID=A0ACC6UBG8_9BURK